MRNCQRPTKRQQIARLVAARTPLERRHLRYQRPGYFVQPHDGWGVCDCATAKRLRNIAAALAGLNTPLAKNGGDRG